MSVNQEAKSSSRAAVESLKDKESGELQEALKSVEQGSDSVEDHFLAYYEQSIKPRKDRARKKRQDYKDGKIDEKPPEFDPGALGVALDKIRQSARQSVQQNTQRHQPSGWAEFENIDRLIEAVEDEERFFDEIVDNDYHNADHTHDVVRRTKKLAEYHDIPERHKQTIMLAAVYHDYAHSVLEHEDLMDEPKQADQTVADELEIDPDLVEALKASYQDDDVGIKEEEFAAFMANERLSQSNERHPTLPPAQRAEIVTAIIGTRFDMGTDEPMAGYSMSRYLEAADLGDVKKDFDEWLSQSFKVWEEEPPDEVSSVNEWVEAQKGFLRFHVAPRFGIELTKNGKVKNKDEAIVPHGETDEKKDWIEAMREKYQALDSLKEEPEQLSGDDVTTDDVVSYLKDTHN